MTCKQPNGQPVIFIPGNAGSYMQVRSIASSSSRQYHGDLGGISADMQGLKKRDFFTGKFEARGLRTKLMLTLRLVDFNEEFSAFHAQTLKEQSEYLAYAVRRVIETYDHLPLSIRPTKVTLLGHSMGGIVARHASITAVGDLVDAILTMSTPHLYPPVTLERQMDDIYSTINSARANDSTPLLFSICGGVSDTQIVSDACALDESLIGPSDGFAVFTTGIPGAWTGVDHQAMVWCHQIRWRVARVLLEMTASEDRRKRLDAAREWLVGPSSLTLSQTDRWSHERVAPSSSSRMSIIVMPRAKDLAQNHPTMSIEQCDAHGSCQPAEGLMTTIPALSRSVSPFPLKGEGVKPEEIGHVIDVDVSDTTSHLRVMWEGDSRLLVGDHRHGQARGMSWKLPKDEKRPVHVSLHWPDIHPSALKVYRLDVKLEQCDGIRPLIRYSGRPRADLAGLTFESTLFPVQESPIFLYSHTGQAPFLPESDFAGSDLDIYQTTLCPVSELRITLDWTKSLAKIASRYRMTMIAWGMGWTSLLVIAQLQSLLTTGMLRDALRTLANTVQERFRTSGRYCLTHAGAVCCFRWR